MTLATTTLSHALADCVDALSKGECLEACLDRYPEHRGRLQPLLEVAQALQDHQPEPTLSRHFLAELKMKLTTEANETPKGGEAHRKRS